MKKHTAEETLKEIDLLLVKEKVLNNVVVWLKQNNLWEKCSQDIGLVKKNKIIPLDKANVS